MTPVSVKNVVKNFGRVRALDDVSLEIERGELFFLLGPSGCGKTTLLRSIAGFYVPDQGGIFFGQTDVTRLPPQKRNTAMVFQNYALWPHMTVEANVGFGLNVRGVRGAERRTRIAAALDMVKMGQYARRRPNQLSGGQQQRVALARALVVRPQCLLLDEPLSNLDARLRLDMRSEIRRLCKEFGLTGVYVTHDQKEALSIADRMAVMFEGKIGQLGTPRELYSRPQTAAIADFLGETNFLPGSVTEGDDSAMRVQTEIGELWAARHGTSSSAPACTVSIRPEAVQVENVGCLVEGENARSKPSAAGAEIVNRFTARVIERIYLGETAQLTLAVGSVRLRADILERAGLFPIAAGGDVACAVDFRDVVVLRN